MSEPLVQIGNFTLNSGKQSEFKPSAISLNSDCLPEFKLIADGFIRDNLDGLVYLIRKATGPFGAVHGIPRGGCMLAEALAKHIAPELPGTLLICDDVLTTGGSMKRAREANAGKFEFIVGGGGFCEGAVPDVDNPGIPDATKLMAEVRKTPMANEPQEPPCPAGRRPHKERVRMIADKLKEGQTAGVCIDNTEQHKAFYLHEIAKYPRLVVEFQGELTADIYVIKVLKGPSLS